METAEPPANTGAMETPVCPTKGAKVCVPFLDGIRKSTLAKIPRPTTQIIAKHMKPHLSKKPEKSEKNDLV